ncbi:MAG: DMT family transporter [Acidobacteria bacterium]|nr:DMT family transporter [Acidobacteriota bacterium]
MRAVGSAGTPAPTGFGRAEAALGVVILAWASSLSIVKFGVGLGDPYAFNLARLIPASLVLLFAVSRTPALRKFEWRDAGRVFVLGVAGHVVFQVGFIHGTDASSATSSALILGLTPVAIAVLAWVTRVEPFCQHTALGLVLTMAGIAFVSGAEPNLSAHLGNLMLFGAMIGWAVYTVRGAALVRKYGALRVTAWSSAVASVLLLLPSPFLLTLADFRQAPAEWWYAALVSGLAAIGLGNMLWVYATGRVGPTLTGVYSNVLPIPSVLISWLWLGETLQAAKIIGAVLIIAGIALARIHHTWGSDSLQRRSRGIRTEMHPG